MFGFEPSGRTEEDARGAACVEGATPRERGRSAVLEPSSNRSLERMVSIIKSEPSSSGMAARFHRRKLSRRGSNIDLINLVVDRDAKGLPNVWVSDPPPPLDLWEKDFEKTQDWHLLDRVKCHVWIELTDLDNKGGKYQGRMTIFWMFRTARLNDNHQPRMRAPGIRAQRLVTEVLESRIWRARDNSTGTTWWKGTTIMTFEGHEIFEVRDFPFDRQVVDLDVFEFVWRSHKDSDSYEESMKVVHMSVETTSMMPEWEAMSALVNPARRREKHSSRNKGPATGHGVKYGGAFHLQLRLQRKPDFFIWQIFLVTYLILSASLLPLGLKPGDVHIGDRMALHAAGLLTLVSFKYSIQADLPIVPYWTFASLFLTGQIITIALVAMEGLFAYKCVTRWGVLPKWIDNVEDIFLCCAIAVWGGFLLHCAFFKKPKAWREVLLKAQTSSGARSCQSAVEGGGELDEPEMRRILIDRLSSCAEWIRRRMLRPRGEEYSSVT